MDYYLCNTLYSQPFLSFSSYNALCIVIQQWLVGYPKNRKTDRKFQNPNRTETENYRFFKNRTEPKPNSKTAVNRKGPLLKFLGEIQEKIRKILRFQLGLLKKHSNPKKFLQKCCKLSYKHLLTLSKKCRVLSQFLSTNADG